MVVGEARKVFAYKTGPYRAEQRCNTVEPTSDRENPICGTIALPR